MEKEKIIGYFDHYKDVYEHSRIGRSTRIDRQANDIARFFSKEDTCPFCGTELETVFLGTRTGTLGCDFFMNGDVEECPNCGWWMLKTQFSEENDVLDADGFSGIYTDTKHYGISRSFQVDDQDLPIHVLNTELMKKPELVYAITPRKLEELARDILRGVYNCEVQHVGKTGDGGKDLIVLDSDSPILVQVKQRQHMDHVELVKGVREFVGTMFIEDARRGIFLSTAKRYSRDSVKTAQTLLDSRKLDYFELIDYERLCQLIKNRSVDKPWKPLVGEFYSDPRARIYDSPEAILDYREQLRRIEALYLKK